MEKLQLLQQLKLRLQHHPKDDGQMKLNDEGMKLQMLMAPAVTAGPSGKKTVLAATVGVAAADDGITETNGSGGATTIGGVREARREVVDGEPVRWCPFRHWRGHLHRHRLLRS